jgi:hypothetical protein
VDKRRMGKGEWMLGEGAGRHTQTAVILPSLRWQSKLIKTRRATQGRGRRRSAAPTATKSAKEKRESYNVDDGE